jgi:protein-disulfide isomerase
MRTYRAALAATWFLGSAAGVGAGERETKDGSALVAVGEGVSVSQSTLDSLALGQRRRLAGEEYRVMQAVLERHIGQMLFAREAKERKLSEAELEKIEVEGKVPPVTSTEINGVLEKSRERFKTLSAEEARAKVEAGIRERKVQLRRMEYEGELRRRAGVKILLDPPRYEVALGDDPARGPQDAPVTIVEFSDFQCPFCAQVGPAVKHVEARWPGKVRVVFRDFPLPFHKEAGKAAEAATCAHEQNRFWEMHDTLFANQKNIFEADLKRYATELGLDVPAFSKCLDSGRYAAEWEADRKEGEGYGIGGTPTVFVNGRMLGGGFNQQALVQVVEEELERVASKPTPSKERAASLSTR